MKIDFIPDDGHWVIVRGFDLLKQQGPTVFSSPIPGIPEWDACWTGERWAANSNDAKRFNTKLQVQTYLDERRRELEQTALTDLKQPAGVNPDEVPA
jgi:hypothetical protein